MRKSRASRRLSPSERLHRQLGLRQWRFWGRRRRRRVREDFAGIKKYAVFHFLTDFFDQKNTNSPRRYFKVVDAV